MGEQPVEPGEDSPGRPEMGSSDRLAGANPRPLGRRCRARHGSDESRIGVVQCRAQRRQHRWRASSLHEDGIFMASYSPSAIGKAAVRKAYDDVFHELKFNVVFHITEVVVMAPEWAFVRTYSVGTTLHHSTGKTTSEANQELFIFRRGADGNWRIAR
jgi:ketosteroid isomerase-like protein